MPGLISGLFFASSDVEVKICNTFQVLLKPPAQLHSFSSSLSIPRSCSSLPPCLSVIFSSCVSFWFPPPSLLSPVLTFPLIPLVVSTDGQYLLCVDLVFEAQGCLSRFVFFSVFVLPASQRWLSAATSSRPGHARQQVGSRAQAGAAGKPGIGRARTTSWGLAAGS